MTARHFRFADVVLGLETSRATDLDWLEEFLAPNFAPTDASAPQRIALDVNAARYASLLAGALTATKSSALEAWPCYALDTEVVCLPSWIHEGQRVLHDEPHGCFILDDSDGLTIVASAESNGRRLVLMRIVREWAAQAHRRNPGVLPLHAAAFAMDDVGFLLAGPKNAGKTTLLVHLLGACAGRLISNDRVFVDTAETHPLIRGLPTVVSIRPGTLQRFPELCRGVQQVPHHSQHSLAELDQRQRSAPLPAAHPPHERLRISPSLFCKQLGVTPVAQAPLGAVILSRVDATARGLKFQRLAPDEAAGQLWACRYGAALGSERTPMVATLVDAALAGRACDDARASCQALAARVPMFTCRLGPDAYDDPAAQRDELAALIQTES